MDTADLEIGLHRRDDEGYQVELRLSRPDSPTDDRLGPTTPVQVQFDLTQLRSLMLNAAAYGKLLGESLFATQELRTTFSTTRKVVESHNWALRIRLFIAPGASELQSLRWETLRDPSEDRCLLTAEQLLFSRYLSSSDWRPVERRPQTDLRALLVIANPSDIAEYNMASLNVTETLKRAKSGFGNIPVTELDSGGTATVENVITQLREDYDILYLVCHGMLVDNEPWLWLEAVSGETQRVSGTAFCTRLKELKHRPRLVMLASCQSAGTGKTASPGEAGALTALGPRLAEAGIPAVIAMQGDISINTIDAFMPVFFQELQRDEQIDRAMSVARGAVRERFDWWMPVLFMRLKDGRLWDIPRSEQEPISKKEPTGIMKLTGQQYKQLQQALLDAFPTETALQQLVMFELDENLAAIASGGNLQAIIFKLIGWAQAQGNLEELIQGAMRSNPNNQALQQVAKTLQGSVAIHKDDKVGGNNIVVTIGNVSGGSQIAIGEGIQQTSTPVRATQTASSPRPVPQVPQLRSEPTTVSTNDEYKEAFRLDKKGRPHDYIQNDYEVQGKVVVDHATGLMWQKSGADNLLTYEGAQKYVEELNRQKSAGNDWRLPTIPELMSLLEPTEKNGNLYIDPVFDKRQTWCWSADRLPESEKGSSDVAWCVIFDFGEVFWRKGKGVKDIGYVRCVRSRE